MKKIGLLLDSAECAPSVRDAIVVLSRNRNLQLFFLLPIEAPRRRNAFREVLQACTGKEPSPSFAARFFALAADLERRMLALFSAMVRQDAARFRLDGIVPNPEIIYFRPSPADVSAGCRWAPEELENIRKLNLDLIVQIGEPGTIAAETLEVAGDGVLAMSFGDDHRQRGGPPAFWEVHHQEPWTGFTIRHRKRGGGGTVFRGNIHTRRTYAENRISIWRESLPYLVRLVAQYAEGNGFPPYEGELPFAGSRLATPPMATTVAYCFRKAVTFGGRMVSRFILRRRPQWHVAFVRAPWQNADLRLGTRIPAPPGHFYGDPFVTTKGARTICYVEDYRYNLKRGCITAIELHEDGTHATLGPVFEEPFHLSFPFLFEYQHELYMVPETVAANAVRLYKCTEFPMKWEYQRDLLPDVRAADPMIFFHGGRWWLLCNRNISGSNDVCMTLWAYSSDSPLSGAWREHRANPLVYDSRTARNAGLLLAADGTPVRCRQKQDYYFYGRSLTLARIAELSPETFREEQIGEILPGFFKGISGCHHLHSDGTFTVYDYFR